MFSPSCTIGNHAIEKSRGARRTPKQVPGRIEGPFRAGISLSGTRTKNLYVQKVQGYVREFSLRTRAADHDEPGEGNGAEERTQD